jgi:hypothetical protein
VEPVAQRLLNGAELGTKNCSPGKVHAQLSLDSHSCGKALPVGSGCLGSVHVRMAVESLILVFAYTDVPAPEQPLKWFSHFIYVETDPESSCYCPIKDTWL